MSETLHYPLHRAGNTVAERSEDEVGCWLSGMTQPWHSGTPSSYAYLHKTCTNILSWRGSRVHTTLPQDLYINR